MDFDYDYDADPFADMDYESLLAWAEENREALIANGLDPDNILGSGQNRVTLGETETIIATLKQCAPQVLSQSAETILLPVLMAFALQVFCRLQQPGSTMGHLFAFVSGFLVLAKLHSFLLASATLLAMLLMVNLSMYVRPGVMAFIIPVILITLELAFSEVWMTIRGTGLVISCKLLSLFLNPVHRALIDKDDSETIISILGYMFHPATVLFGPWISFDEYIDSIESPHFSLGAIIGPIFPASLCLITSTCFFSLFPKIPGHSWYTSIIKTYSFHASHYYIMFTTQSLVALSGVEVREWYSGVSDVVVPYEMNQVCRSWNRPINRFLKEHIFFHLRATTGRAFSIVGTFLFSALLHGLNFPIFVTLVTLGASAYGEFEIRRKLSRYYGLVDVAPKGLVVKPTPETGNEPNLEKKDDTEDPEFDSRLDQIALFLSWPWRISARLTKVVASAWASKATLSMAINNGFLIVNLIHLFYLGILFSEPDMPIIDCLKHMAGFDFISAKLALVTFIFGYLC